MQAYCVWYDGYYANEMVHYGLVQILDFLHSWVLIKTTAHSELPKNVRRRHVAEEECQNMYYVCGHIW